MLELVRINFDTEQPDKDKPYVIQVDGEANVSEGGPVAAIVAANGEIIYL